MKSTILHFLFVLILSIVIKDVHNKSHGRSAFRNLKIIGGKNTTIEQHPYLVAILVPFNGSFAFGCGGTIINPRYILTAAHCVRACLRNHPLHELRVRAGSSHNLSGGSLYKLKRGEFNPLSPFPLSVNDYDVGFFELSTNIPLNGKTTKVISLPPLGTTPVKPGTNVTVVGWGTSEIPPVGKTTTTAIRSPRLDTTPVKLGTNGTAVGWESSNMASLVNQLPVDQLREVTLPTITNEQCFIEYTDVSITPRMLCAGGQRGSNKSACYGDSGGPAVDSSTGVQLGIVSFGEDCRPGWATVFTNLSNYEVRMWIKNNTGI